MVDHRRGVGDAEHTPPVFLRRVVLSFSKKNMKINKPIIKMLSCILKSRSQLLLVKTIKF